MTTAEPLLPHPDDGGARVPAADPGRGAPPPDGGTGVGGEEPDRSDRLGGEPAGSDAGDGADRGDVPFRTPQPSDLPDS